MQKNTQSIDVYGLLANETRVRILEAIANGSEPVAPDELTDWLSVSSIDMIEYHIEKLDGVLIRFESGGFGLTDTGRRITASLQSLEHAVSTDDVIELNASCHNCGGEVAVEIDDSNVRLHCTDCQLQHTKIHLPYISTVDRSDEAILTEINRATLARQRIAEGGMCHICWGEIEARTMVLESDKLQQWYESEDPGIVRRYECRQCQESWQSLADLVLLSNPVIDAFHYDHGTDIRESPWWELEWLGSQTPVIRSGHPFQIEFTLELDDELLTVVMDEDMSIITSQRYEKYRDSSGR